MSRVMECPAGPRRVVAVSSTSQMPPNASVALNAYMRSTVYQVLSVSSKEAADAAAKESEKSKASVKARSPIAAIKTAIATMLGRQPVCVKGNCKRCWCGKDSGGTLK